MANLFMRHRKKKIDCRKSTVHSSIFVLGSYFINIFILLLIITIIIIITTYIGRFRQVVVVAVPSTRGEPGEGGPCGDCPLNLGGKNKKIIIKDKKLTLNNCWTMDKHLHDYHILGGAKRFCCQRAVGALTTIFWHQTMKLNCLTL